MHPMEHTGRKGILWERSGVCTKEKNPNINCEGSGNKLSFEMRQ